VSNTQENFSTASLATTSADLKNAQPQRLNKQQQLQDAGISNCQTQINALTAQIAALSTPSTIASLPIEDLRANLSNYPATNYKVGRQFFATDWRVTYIVVLDSGSGQNQWYYESGMYEAPFPIRPGTPLLGVYDQGLEYRALGISAGVNFAITERWNGSGWEYLYGVSTGPYPSLMTLAGQLTATEIGWSFNETTYGHNHVWSGSVWQWGPGEMSGQTVGPQANPPNVGVWQACDGSTVQISQPDGSAPANVVTQNLNGVSASGNVVLASGGFSTTIVAASASTGTAAAVTATGSVNAITSINPPSSLDGGMPPLYTGSWWIRV
jgi:hypothetical protein